MIVAVPVVVERIRRLAPGIALSAGVGLVAWLLALVEVRLLGHAVVEALVAAILVGMLVRTLWTPPATTEPGVGFAAREVLEVAVLLLGASVDLPLLVSAGPALAAGIVTLVALGLAASYALGRFLGLPRDLAVLVACGNAICGNSAIAAVAPVIGADAEHVASSIAFTAILGVVVVVGLPLLIHPLGLSEYQYGVVAGLTVYAVPQVLAAAFPVGMLAGQVGTLVKLVRVLMLGPVVLFFALRQRRRAPSAPSPSPAGADRAPAQHATAPGAPAGRRARLVPWFIVGFLLLAALRSAGLLPEGWVAPTRAISGWLTILAMAALGLGVDVRAIAKVGRPVIATTAGSLLLLLALSVTLVHVLRIG
ncbi:MAG TPA: putative sulfate exporter family transporter [Gemmatimonadaceae bacterium]|nr:putative sulfate exporter family transporter [Gemmatimonadaceae bacterium]